MKLIEIAANAMQFNKILRKDAWGMHQYVTVNQGAKNKSLVLCSVDEDGKKSYQAWNPTTYELLADDFYLAEIIQPEADDAKCKLKQDEAKPACESYCHDVFQLERLQRLLELKKLEYAIWEHEVRQYEAQRQCLDYADTLAKAFNASRKI